MRPLMALILLLTTRSGVGWPLSHISDGDAVAGLKAHLRRSVSRRRQARRRKRFLGNEKGEDSATRCPPACGKWTADAPVCSVRRMSLLPR